GVRLDVGGVETRTLVRDVVDARPQRDVVGEIVTSRQVQVPRSIHTGGDGVWHRDQRGMAHLVDVARGGLDLQVVQRVGRQQRAAQLRSRRAGGLADGAGEVVERVDRGRLRLELLQPADHRRDVERAGADVRTPVQRQVDAAQLPDALVTRQLLQVDDAPVVRIAIEQLAPLVVDVEVRVRVVRVEAARDDRGRADRGDHVLELHREVVDGGREALRAEL